MEKSCLGRRGTRRRNIRFAAESTAGSHSGDNGGSVEALSETTTKTAAYKAGSEAILPAATELSSKSQKTKYPRVNVVHSAIANASLVVNMSLSFMLPPHLFSEFVGAPCHAGHLARTSVTEKGFLSLMMRPPLPSSCGADW